MITEIPTLGVYVSSTWKDLKPERAAVESVIHSLNETKFVGMEYFGSRDETTSEASVNAMDQVSLYVVIVGERYGSGITEKEYDRALELRIPCHVYCKRKKSATTGPREPAENKDQLRRFVNRLRDQTKGHLVTEFSTADELAKRVVVDLHNFLYDRYVVPMLQRARRERKGQDTLAGLSEQLTQLASFNRSLWSRIDQPMKGHGWMPAAPASLNETDVVLPSAVQQAILNEYPALKEHVYPEFGDLIARLTGSFVGRTSVFEKISEFTGRFSSGYFQIVGGAGLGKTALAAEIARRFDAPIFFASISAGHSRAAQCLRHLCAELILRRGLPYETLPERAGTDASFLLELLRQIPRTREQPVWLVVDALDEADKPETGQNALLLPSNLPEHVYCVVTRRDDVALFVDPPAAFSGATLGADTEEQTEDIRAYLASQVLRPDLQRALNVEPSINTGKLLAALARASAGNFKYLEYSLADLAARRPGDPPVDLSRLPLGLSGYYDHFWARMESVKESEDWQDWTKLYRPTIGMLAIAGEPVSADWLASQIDRDSQEIRERALSRWRRFLTITERGETELWSIVHKSFADFLREKKRLDLKDLHRQVGEYFSKPAQWDTFGRYALRHLARHLRESNSEELFRLVDDQTWYERQINSDATASPFIADVGQAWELAESLDQASIDAHSPPLHLARQFSCGLVTATFRTVAGNLPAALISSLVSSGAWTIEQALESAQRNTNPLNQVRTLVGIAAQVSGSRKQELLEQARTIANDIKEADVKASALMAIEPQLPAGARLPLFAALVDCLSSISSYPNRADLYRALSERLPADPSLLQEALQVGEDLVDGGYDLPLLKIAERIGPAVFDQVVRKGLRHARKARTETTTVIGWRLSFLPHLSARERRQLIDEEIENAVTYDPGETYAGLLRNLDGDDRAQVIAAAHSRVMAEEYPSWRAALLEVLLPVIDKPARSKLIAAALTGFSDAPDDYGWARLCLAVIPYVPITKRRELLRKGIDALELLPEDEIGVELINKYAQYADAETSPRLVSLAEKIANGSSRSEVLAGLLPVLPDSLRVTVLDKAQSAAWSIGDEPARVKFLGAIIERCPTASKSLLVEEMLAAARRIADFEKRAEALTRVIPLVDGEVRATLVAEALASAKQLSGRIIRPMKLAALLEYLAEPALGEVLDLLCQDLVSAGSPVDDARFESHVLPKLLRFVETNEVLAKNLIAALDSIGNQLNRIRAQAELLPHLSASTREKMQQQLLDEVEGMKSSWEGQSALATIASYVDDSLRPSLISEAFANAGRIRGGRRTSEVFGLICYHLPHWIKKSPSCWQDALAAVKSLDSVDDRGWVVTYLIDHLPAKEKRWAISEAKAAAAKTKNNETKVVILRKLIEQFTGATRVRMLAEAASAAQQAGPVTRALSLAVLAQHADGQRSEFLKLALDAVRETPIDITVPSHRSYALKFLVPFLLDDPTLRDEAIEMILNLDREQERATLIAALVDQAVKRDPGLQYYLWRKSYPRLAAKPRDLLIAGLAPLVPLIESLGGEKAIAEAGQAVVRCAARWP